MTARPSWATYLLRALAAIVAVLPWRALPALGAALGWLAGSALRIRRAHVDAAMRRAGIAREEAPRMYRSLGTACFEFLWLAGRRRAPIAEIARVAEADAWRALAGRGVVLAASHTGNWDLAACAVAESRDVLVVTKRLSARGIDAFWQGARSSRGVSLCEARGALSRGAEVIRRGGAVAMMIDQVPLAKKHAIAAEFLGARALVDRAAATLAARTGAPLVVCAARRDGADHVLHVLEVLEPPPRAGRAWIDDATLRATAALDRFVRAHPSAWLWMHRRWKDADDHKCLRAMSAQVPLGSISK